MGAPSSRSLQLLAASAIALWVGALGCSSLSPCDTSSQDPVPWTGGQVEDGFYMSTPWTGPFLPFPPGKRYLLMHGLGCVPHDIDCFLSFGERGMPDNSVAAAAGNMCLVQQIDETSILIKNDSCAEMFVVVTAQAPLSCGDGEDAGTEEGGAAGAGGSVQ